MNLFRQAAELLKAKDAGTELIEEEFRLVNTAEGLEELAKLIDGVRNGNRYRTTALER